MQTIKRFPHLTHLLKLIWWVIMDGFNLITHRKYRPKLYPAKHLEPLDEQGTRWAATGPDPQFVVGGATPLGTTLARVRASSDKPTIMGFYRNQGRGYSQADFTQVGVLTGQPTDFQVVLPVSRRTHGLRLDPADAPCTFTLHAFSFQRVTQLELVLRAGWAWAREADLSLRMMLGSLWAMYQQYGVGEIRRLIGARLSLNSDLYAYWLERNTPTPADLAAMRGEVETFAYTPTVSLITPVYNTPERLLREMIDSVRAQVYPHWELCIADDASTRPYMRRVLKEYQAAEQRIKVVWRAENGHISAASNSALEIASGEFIATLDHDDVITPDALYEVVKLLNAHPNADMIYSDEDKISEDGRRFKPYFKPSWSPDLFLSHMYTAHFAVYRRTLVQALGGYRLGYEGAQDYDLVLRLTERTDKIYHIPRVLYSWRRTEGSTAVSSQHKPYASQAAHRAIAGALERRGRPAKIETAPGHAGQFLIQWALQGQPLISIIILTRDKASLVDQCLTSIFEKTAYPHFEVILLDNGSEEQATFDVIEKWRAQEPARFRCARHDIPFNFHTLNNLGAKAARGDIYLFLNNDTEVISPDWLEKMAAQAQRPEIGVVGCVLLFPNDTIQHAGIVLGIAGWAGHSHKHAPAGHPGYEGRLLGPSNYAAITGACMMIARGLFWQLGGMDEHLQIACGDVALCLKALDTGRYNVVLPDVCLYHYESASRGYEKSTEQQARFEREAAYVIERWPHLFALDPFYNPNLTLKKEDFSLAIDS